MSPEAFRNVFQLHFLLRKIISSSMSFLSWQHKTQKKPGEEQQPYELLHWLIVDLGGESVCFFK